MINEIFPPQTDRPFGLDFKGQLCLANYEVQDVDGEDGFFFRVVEVVDGMGAPKEVSVVLQHTYPPLSSMETLVIKPVGRYAMK